MAEYNEDKELFNGSDLSEGDSLEMSFGFGELFDEIKEIDFEVVGRIGRKNGDKEDGGEGSDLVSRYFKSLGNIPIFSPEEEKKAFSKYKKMREEFRRKLYHFPLAQKIKKAEENLLASVEMSEEEKDDVIEERVLGKIKFYIEEASENGVAGHSTIEKKIGMKASRLKLLWREISKAQSHINMMKDYLVEKNLRLVVPIAKNYINRGLSLIDLIQEGNIGLMKSINKFKVEQGYKFSTYSTWWIKQAITRALIDKVRTIRAPVHVAESLNKILRTQNQLIQEFSREPSNEEIANKIGMLEKKVASVLEATQHTLDLEHKVGHDDDTELGSFIADENSLSPFKETQSREMTERILNILDTTLTPKEAKVIKMRFGIGYDRDYTLQEIGNNLKITRERVRQIESKVIKKLSHSTRRRKLEKLLD